MHVSGAGVYTTETFKAGTRERPKQVILDVGGGTPRSKTPVALGALHDPGQPQGAADRFLGYDGGHVAGLQLGGANENYNVVPMYPGFNRGVWKNVEDEVAQAKTWGYSGMPFRAKIVLAYANSQRVVPRSLHMETTTRRPRKNKTLGPWETVKDYGTRTQPDDIPTTTALSTTDADTILGVTGKTTTLKDAATHLKNVEGNKAAAKVVKTTGALPPATRSAYPDDPANRPYGYLDLLTFANKINPSTTFGVGRTFSGTQRKLILQANMAKNGGTLKSDDPADPHQVLSERGTADFPEIDHIIPKSLGGSNFFANARVVSWELNNKLARVKGIANLVNPQRIALPTLTGTKREQIETGITALLSASATRLTRTQLVTGLQNKFNLHLSVNDGLTVTDVIQSLVTDGSITRQGGNVVSGAKTPVTYGPA